MVAALMSDLLSTALADLVHPKGSDAAFTLSSIVIGKHDAAAAAVGGC